MADFLFEISDELYEAIRAIAERNGRSVEEEARIALIEGYSRSIPMAAKPVSPD